MPNAIRGVRWSARSRTGAARRDFDMVAALFWTCAVVFVVTAAMGVWTAYDRSGAWPRFLMILAGITLALVLARTPAGRLSDVADAAGALGAGLALVFLVTISPGNSTAELPLLKNLAEWWPAEAPSMALLVKHDIVSRAVKGRHHKPIFMIDISVPRNIDPDVNNIDNVYLYDIDNLQGVVTANVQGRQKEAEKAEEIITQEVETYLQWERSLDAVPTIVDLREKVEDIRKRELEKTLCQLNGISEEQRNAVEALSTAIVNKIVHAPIVVLKQATSNPESGDLFSFARKLFNLDKELKRHVHEKGFGGESESK